LDVLQDLGIIPCEECSQDQIIGQAAVAMDVPHLIDNDYLLSQLVGWRTSYSGNTRERE
jgi:hypothetical protein